MDMILAFLLRIHLDNLIDLDTSISQAVSIIEVDGRDRDCRDWWTRELELHKIYSSVMNYDLSV